MKRALVALLLVACAGAPVIERAPTVPTPPEAPRALELSFHPSRIFAGKAPNAEHAEGTLLMVSEIRDEHIRRLDELDIATMRVSGSLDFGRRDFAAFAERDGALYVVTVTMGPKRGVTHTLDVVDVASMKIVQSANTEGELSPLHGEETFPPVVSVGTRGVRVTFRGSCPSSVQDEDCVHYETHRFDDFTVAHDHIVPLGRVRLVHVPDDFGELPPEAKRDRHPPCTTRGIFFADDVWVGDDYFALRFGCCGSPPGGFFECKATK